MKQLSQYIIESSIEMSHEDKLSMTKKLIDKNMDQSQKDQIKKYVNRCKIGQISPETLYRIYSNAIGIKKHIIYPWDKKAHHDMMSSK